MKNKIAEIIATWFGCGKSPKAPGTVGSLGALPVIWLLSHYHADVFAMLILALFLFFIGVWATDVMIKKSAVKDPSFVVIDEVVGQMISFALIWPMLGHQHAWGEREKQRAVRSSRKAMSRVGSSEGVPPPK